MICNTTVLIISNTCIPATLPALGIFWQPWAYSNWLEVAGKVEKFKKSLEKKHLTDATKQSKVTSYIASQKSRQEFVPLLGNIRLSSCRTFTPNEQCLRIGAPSSSTSSN